MNRDIFAISRRSLLASGAALGATAALSTGWPIRALAGEAKPGPVVETRYGKLRGVMDGDVAVYRGIRYGASTAGANRFKPPQTPPSWSGVMEADRSPAIAPQRNPARTAPAGGGANGFAPSPNMPESEDCLRLMVCTKAANSSAKLPVMVWFHGGGYSSGSGSMPLYYGGGLAELGVVSVSVTHRLNAFGYTYLADILGDDYALSGNAGHLDMVAALEWVRDNIAGFGGDPDNVTIFGESGGGMKVSALMAMPAAKGLYHKAIIESGPGLALGRPEHATQGAEAFLAALGLTRANAHSITDLPMERLLEGYFASLRKGGSFNPLVDGKAIPRDPFTPNAPPQSADVPLLIGTNHHEMGFFFRSRQEPDLDMAGFKKHLSTYKGLDVDAAVAAYQAENPGASPWKLWLTASSDFMMRANSIALAERKAKQKAPVYMYRFDWETPMLGGHLGAMHVLEVAFMLNNLKNARWLVGDAPETDALSARMSKAWTDFAKSGNPGWATYDAAKRQTMIFNTQDRLVSDPASATRKLVMGAMNLA